MSDADGEDQPQTFFTKINKRGPTLQDDDQLAGGSTSIAAVGSDEGGEDQGQCLTLRFIQRILPCFERKSVWEASQGDVYKSHEAEETKYPMVLRILESKAMAIIFFLSCLASAYMFFFAEGFISESHIFLAILHTVNTIFTLGLFGQWLQILIESKYSKTNQGYKKFEVALAILCVFPSDLIVLTVYSINGRSFSTHGDRVAIMMSRLNYLLRLIYAQKRLAVWENQLVLGDIAIFLLRVFVYVTFFIHAVGCVWHRIACEPFQARHFLMTPQEAANDACSEDSWIALMLAKSSPVSNYPEDESVVVNHYFVSMYWVVDKVFRFGDGNIQIVMTSKLEVLFTSATQIVSWIFLLAYVTGTLTSLLIEHDTERECYKTRRYAMKQYLEFSYTGRSILKDIRNYYDLLWARRKGISHLSLIDRMPTTMKAEVFFDMNRFVISQLPLLSKMEDTVLMRLAAQMRHSFHLEGEILFRKNQTGRCFYFIFKGFLEVLNERETAPITNIKSGSGIGEIYLMHPYPHAATVRCGSQCDIMILTRKDFRDIISLYPELWDTLNSRVANRLNQSEILLSLAGKKFNGYLAAMARIHVKICPVEEQLGNKIMLPTSGDSDDHLGEQLLDFYAKKTFSSSTVQGDDASTEPMDIAMQRYSLLSAASQMDDDGKGRLRKNERRRRSLEEEAYAAIENDVNGATKLGRDLGITNPPLAVTVPARFVKGRRGTLSDYNRKNFLSRMVPIPSLRLSEPDWHFIWKSWITVCILVNIWFATLQWAFRQPYTVVWSFAAHTLDIFICADFCMDVLKSVVMPMKSLETKKEILMYRIRTVTFYLRLIGFLPVEYVVAEIAGWNWQSGEVSPWFYFFKFNRAFELVVVAQFLDEIESRSRVHMLAIFMLKFNVVIFLVIHIFGVFYEALIRDWLSLDEYPSYFEALYYSAQVITSTGYGHFSAKYDSGIITLAIGLLIGTITITYFGAKVAALMANQARRRLSFKHLYYSLLSFMKLRHFPKQLEKRIIRYYRMQWRTHEGVLTPTVKSIFWDAPSSIVDRVATAQALRFISRIPLAQHTPRDVQTTFCKALRRYFVPPGEIILYPGDFRRELYIIVKGYCQVLSEDRQLIGSMGEGNYFGLPGLINGVNKQYYIVTETHCQFYCLLYQDFMELADNNKAIGLDYRALKGLHNRHSLKYTNALAGEARRATEEKESQDRKIGSEVMDPEEEDQEENEPITEEGFLFSNSAILIVQRSPVDFSKNTNCSKFWQYFMCSFNISPTGNFLKYWVLCRTVAAILVTLFVGIQAAFAIHPTMSFAIMIIFDCVAYANIYIMLHVAFYDDGSHRVERALQISQHYLKGPFILDIIACFPLEFGVYISHPSSLNTMISPDGLTYGGDYGLFLISFLRLNRMLQIYHLFTAIAYLDKSIFRSLTFVALIEVIPTMFVFLNTMACIVFLAICHWDEGDTPLTCHPDSWVMHFKPFHPKKPEADWITRPEYEFEPSSYYVLTFWWVSQCALHLGFGDFELSGYSLNLELAILLTLLGVIVVVYLGGKLGTSAIGKDSQRIAVREEMEVLYRFMDQYHVSDALKMRVKNTYFHNWERTGGVSHEEFFVTLHPNLKADAAAYMYEERMLKCPLLQILETDKAGVRMLASKLKEVFYPEGEYIMKFGDLNDDFFLITKGVIVSYRDNGEIMSYMGPGSLIGEISAILGIRRVFSTVAATNVDVFVFQRNDFLDFLELYPELILQLEYACVQHYRESLPGRSGLSTDSLVTKAEAAVKPRSSYPRQPSLDDVEKGEINSALTAISQSSKKTSIKFVEGDVTEDFRNEKLNKAELVEREMINLDNLEMSYLETKEELVGSYVSLTELEAAAEHPEFINDPLRVTMKPKREGVDRHDVGSEPVAVKKSFRGRFLTFGRLPRNEMGMCHIFQERKEIGWKHFTIHPASPICASAFFACFWILLACFSCSLASFEMAFGMDYRTGQDKVWLIVVRTLVEFFFVFRCIGNFFLGFYNETGDLITDWKSTSRRYLGRPSGFAIDILTTFPFNFFEFISILASCSVIPDSRDSEKIYALSTSLLALKLLRVVHVMRYLTVTETDLRLKVSLIKIVKICIVLCFVFHFCACAWYLVACIGLRCAPASWVSRTIERFIHATDDDEGLDNEITSPENVTVSTRYVLSLYYVITIMTFTGLDNIEPTSLAEICFTICLLFATIFVIGYLVGEMTQCLAAQIASKIHYQHEFAVLQEHFTGLGLSKGKSHEVRKYYKTLWQKSRGITYSEVLHKLPYPLRADIAYEIYGSSVKSCRILSKIDDVIIREICARIKHEIYLPGSHIVRAGEICDAMYVIKKGEIVILDESQNLDICVEELYENECFGEIKLLLPREQYHFSYIARLDSEVGVLYRPDFEEIFENYPTLREDLTVRAQKIKEHRTKQKESQAEAMMDEPDDDDEDRDDDEAPWQAVALPVPEKYEPVGRLSIHGGPTTTRMRAFSEGIRKKIDEKSSEQAKKTSFGSGSQHSAQIH